MGEGLRRQAPMTCRFCTHIPRTAQLYEHHSKPVWGPLASWCARVHPSRVRPVCPSSVFVYGCARCLGVLCWPLVRALFGCLFGASEQGFVLSLLPSNGFCPILARDHPAVKMVYAFVASYAAA